MLPSYYTRGAEKQGLPVDVWAAADAGDCGGGREHTDCHAGPRRNGCRCAARHVREPSGVVGGARRMCVLAAVNPSVTC